MRMDLMLLLSRRLGDAYLRDELLDLVVSALCSMLLYMY